MGGASGGQPRFVYRAIKRSGLVAAVVASAASPTRGFDASVAWSPVHSVAGYRVYVRQSGQAYGSGVDVGLVPAGTDGVVRYVRVGVPNDVTNYFAVTAYDAAGHQSALSNELSLLVTATPTATVAQAATASQTRTATASWTPTASASASRTPTVTATAPRTPTVTRTATRTPTFTATVTVPPTATATPSASPTPTPSPAATTAPSPGISGQVSYYANGAPVPDVTLTLQSTQSAVGTSSDSLGQYVFAGVGPATWQLTPQKDGGVQGAISALDAAYVLQAVAGLRTFDAFQTLACDVTGDGTLSSVDAARILQFTVGDLARFPVAETCGSDWVFVPQPLIVPMQQLVAPQMSAAGCQNGAILFEPLQENAAQQDFAAALFGDCTGNWSAAASGAALRRLASPGQAWLGPPRPRPGAQWAVSLYVDRGEDLQALEAHVSYDPTHTVLQAVHVVQAPSALLRSHADSSGLVTIALASAQPQAAAHRPLAVLVFSGPAPPQVELRDALIDDLPAQVANTAAAP